MKRPVSEYFGNDINPKSQAIFEELITKTAGTGIKPGMEVIREMLRRLGNPHKTLPTIHVAGTNGKGSVSAMLERCLREAGLRTGLYTSPHMMRYNERFRVDGVMIGDDALLALLHDVCGAAAETEEALGSKPKEFEILTAMAFLLFKRHNIDVLVLETGMGGRFDATNVCDHPVLSVITSISFDHEMYLGDTLPRIAAEKAGIIKAGSPLVTSCSAPDALAVLLEEFEGYGQEGVTPRLVKVVEDCAWERESLGLKGQRVNLRTPGGQYKDIYLSLSGAYQCENLAAVVAAWEILASEDSLLPYGRELLTESALRKGLASVSWPCRLELVQENPTVVLDGSHNPDGIRKSAEWLAGERDKYRDVILVMGMLQDKDRVSAAMQLDGMVSRLIITKPLSERAGQWKELADGFHQVPEDKLVFIEDCHEAVRTAIRLASENDLVLCTGSFYLVGEMRKNWPDRTLF